MSGNVDDPKKLSERAKEVMELFNVDEKMAQRIVDYGVQIGCERFERWTANLKALKKTNAEKTFELFGQLKRKLRDHMDPKAVIDEIEGKILELCRW